MDIKKLITNNNKNLYNSVNSIHPVKLQPTSDTSWSSYVDAAGNTIINYTNTAYPESCFVHELLHISTQIRGFKRLESGMTASVSRQLFKEIMDKLDNEFQHHKMFPEFEKLKYPSDEFYIDSDVDAQSKIRQVIADDPIYFNEIFLNFLALIAPGGTIEEKTKKQLIIDFKAIQKGIFSDFLNFIDGLFAKWAADSSLDSKPYMKEIFSQFPHGKMTWLSYGNVQNFPNDGYFIDGDFTKQEFIDYLIANNIRL